MYFYVFIRFICLVHSLLHNSSCNFWINSKCFACVLMFSLKILITRPCLSALNEWTNRFLQLSCIISSFISIFLCCFLFGYFNSLIFISSIFSSFFRRFENIILNIRLAKQWNTILILLLQYIFSFSYSTLFFSFFIYFQPSNSIRLFRFLIIFALSTEHQ